MSLIDQAKEQMAKTVENTKENFSGIRTGRANPALLNGITVDYYGAPTPIKAVASIGVPEPRTLSVTPFDASQAGAVEKALRNSDLGISPNRDGNVIRLTMPELTEAVKAAKEEGTEVAQVLDYVNCNMCVKIKESELENDDLKNYKAKAEFAGGAILILIGLKILLEHLGILSF